MADRRSAQTLAIVAQQELQNSVKNQVNTVQTQLESKGLGAATIKAQQELAEKFGIVTFDTTGAISTIPLTREIDTSIDVGTGKYTSQAFYDSVRVIKSQLTPPPEQVDFFSSYIAQPIEKFINDLFGVVSYEDLPPELQAQVDELQAKADTERRIHESLRNDYNHYELYRGYLAQIDAIYKQFSVDTKVKDEVLNMTAKINELLKVPYFTPQLKTEATNEIKQASALLEKLITSGAEITQSLVNELTFGVQSLAFKLSEPTQQPASDLILDLGKIGEDLLGGAQQTFTDLGKFFFPETDQIVEQIKREIEAQMKLIPYLRSLNKL